MSRNASGTYTLPSDTNPVVTDTTITPAWANGTLGDIGTALTDSLSRSGKGGMTAPLRTADGTVAAPSVAFTSETGSGWFRHAAGELRLAILGVYRLAVTALGMTVNGNLGATGTLDVSGAATVASLTSYDRVNVYDGSAGKRVSIDAAAGQAADYTLTLPAAVPASTLPVTMTSAGALATAQLVNAQQNFGTPSADTDVAIKSYVDTAVEVTTAALTGATNWTGVTNTAAYAVFSDQVFLTGKLVCSNNAAVSGDLITTLPAGSRPGETKYFAAMANLASTLSANGYISVELGGSVKWFGTGDPAANDIIYLDGITFTQVA